MATLKEFKKRFKPYTDHEGFSNIDVRGHCDCPNCGANLLALFHLYPEMLFKYGNTGNGGFSFMGYEFYRKPDGEIVENKPY